MVVFTTTKTKNRIFQQPNIKISFLISFRNPSCTKQPPLPPPCDPRCAKTAGKCNTETGKCTCCRDFTGPNPVFNPKSQTIGADYCDTYCPYVVGGKP